MRMLTMLSLVAILGCGGGEKVSFQTAEDSRRQARENSSQLAQDFRAQSQGIYADYAIVARGDSTISNECPMGDGWATMDFVDKKTQPPTVLQVKCSTYSEGIGCMTAADFKAKAYAKEDGTCNHEVPFPLPKLSK